MSVVPGSLETDQQPPMTVPLRHFVLGFAVLLLGIGLGFGIAIGVVPGAATLAHLHLLFAGWISLTIMGAMTQFVPVWSGANIYSRRLATVQLWLVVVGLLGFAGSLLTGRLSWLHVFGVVMLAGFWAFSYNIGRTLWGLDTYDVTERHFAIALGFFLLVTALGYLLALDMLWPLFGESSVARSNVVAAHATVAVFGAVLTTVVGALYQLGTMFTQSELHGIDTHLRRAQEVAYPSGVIILATGRLLGISALGTVGGTLVAGSLLGVSVILARRLYGTQVEWTPMLSRYAVVAPALALWSSLAVPAWIRDPLASDALLGAPGTSHLLVFGVIGFVVFGTLYHVVPFIIWVHRYSDQLGFGEVPMIDDLYNDRIAVIDSGLLVGSLVLLASNEWMAFSPIVTGIAGLLAVGGVILFTTNMMNVVLEHSPYSLGGVLFSTVAERRGDSSEDIEVGDGPR
ncbi:MAG: hypothetical protein ABEH66_02290 [Halobacteriales archaeon]